MPNGGTFHCGHCYRLEPKSQRCTLRNIYIENTHYTTCHDMDFTPSSDMEEDTDKPHGPVYSKICVDPPFFYGEIPWFQGNRVGVEKDQDSDYSILVVSNRKGERLEFPNVDAYMNFWAANEDQ